MATGAVLVGIDDDGEKDDRGKGDDDSVPYGTIPTEEDKTKAIRANSSPDTDIRVTHNDAERYGAIPGCLVCQHIINGTEAPGGVGHSATCRSRTRDLI